MSNEPYDPNSVDAKLATIIANQVSSAQSDKEFREALLARVKVCEAAIATLMQWRYYIVGFSAGIALVGNRLLEYISENHK